MRERRAAASDLLISSSSPLDAAPEICMGLELPHVNASDISEVSHPPPLFTLSGASPVAAADKGAPLSVRVSARVCSLRESTS